MANWNNPVTTSTYTNFVTEVKDRDLDAAKGLDPAIVTVTNPVANMIRWTSASSKWEKYNGTAWGDLSALYAISISGTASNVTGTVLAAKGGTGQTSYAVGDILFASTTTALSKLAGVATGNALISGGVGIAPSWGKIGLTTHVSGTLAVDNGGTGQASYAVGDLLYASATTAISKLADVATGNVLLTGGVGVAPSYGKVGLTTHISGTLAVANGGTGATTAAAARTTLGAAADSDGVGRISLYPATVAPAGEIKANGALLSRTTYARLWAYAQTSGNLAASDAAWTKGKFSPGDGSTTFRILDMRGEFPRFWDDGAGIDSGRTIGSWQDQAIQTHNHSIWGELDGGVANFTAIRPTATSGTGNTISANSGGADTRPRNVALLACMKY